MESTANQVRDAIKQLPIQQRAVAIALKKIFDQIKQLTRKEQQEIDANHLSFISKFKVLQKKASHIIQGVLLKDQDLGNSAQFFSNQEQIQKNELLKQKNKIQEYWHKVFANSQLGPDLNEQQHIILKAVIDVQTNITTNEIEIIFTIQQNNYVQKGVFNRRLVLENGMPISFQGQEPKWKSQQQKKDGFFTSFVFYNTKNQDQLPTIFSAVGNIVNQLVPYSLQYYLGAVNQEEQGEVQQDNQQQIQEDGQDQ